MNYWKYRLCTDSTTAEVLLAYLAEAPFDSFQETDEGLDAYLPDAQGNREIAEALLGDLQQEFSFDWEAQFLPAQNWNAIWEANFPPVVIEDFCAVRAPFHAPIAGVVYDLVIEPKMAFGTGHHETTWMCLRALRDLPCAGARLLDFGCGSGVLAILAARLGAAEVVAVDIEEESFRSTAENSAANGVAEQVRVYWGDLSAVPEGVFDGILANINRNVILASLPDLHQRLRAGGWLLISGILLSDADIVGATARQAGFLLKRRDERGTWLCLLFQKA
ncbi:MAG: 50S ribosomal protein L11 methyltransferase [Saprospiraceae bacterium]|nr:50S ribosomal protein L11 methyltransferase [Saprospiraceae bacterium]MDW8229014.1 50S ribosomal protein L11 methyltransferase [Saprospiraceae bacterium]